MDDGEKRKEQQSQTRHDIPRFRCGQSRISATQAAREQSRMVLTPQAAEFCRQ
jgi:hypothetical protein